MERRTQEIRLPGGETMLAAVTQLGPERDGDDGGFADAADPSGWHGAGDGADEDGEYEDTGALDRLSRRVQGLNELVSGVGSAVLEAARDARPDEVNATFGVEFAAKAGRALAILADGEAKGSISVTLTWRLDGPQQPPQQPPASPGGTDGR